MSDLSILVVTSSPDRRDSTTELGTLIVELRRRTGLDVTVWYLRQGEVPPWPGSRVVDDLRTATVPAALDVVRLTPLAGVLRGRELRRWWSEVAPDVVILDDALGERLLPTDRSDLVVVHRHNVEAPEHAWLEAAPSQPADIQLVPVDATPPPGPPAPRVLPTHPRSDLEPARPFADDGARAIVRTRLGLPTDGLLVVGWGDHAWFDGPDMFVRTIWTIRERLGVDAHGLWVGSDDDGEVAAVLEDEAQRCDLADRITHRAHSSIDVRLCGDVVLLPYRDDGELELVHQAAITGCEVITFPVWRTTSPTLHTVEHLDLEAAAAAVVEAASGDRAARAKAASDSLDIAPFVDDLLEAIADRRKGR